MSERLQFFKGLESDLPTTYVTGALYHCTDTGNTYLATSTSELKLYSTSTSINNKTGDVTLTASDVGALPNTTVIPSIEGLATETYVDNAVSNIDLPNGFVVQKEAPTDKTVLWVDEDDDTDETANIKPIKGVDYWTDEDKAEIKAYVDEAILGGAW